MSNCKHAVVNMHFTTASGFITVVVYYGCGFDTKGMKQFQKMKLQLLTIYTNKTHHFKIFKIGHKMVNI